MEPLIIYLLKANVVISILFLFYVAALKNEKSFWQNRFYLLSGLLLSLFLPLLPGIGFWHLNTIQSQITTANPLDGLYSGMSHTHVVNTHVNTVAVSANPGFTMPSLSQILVGAYLLVSLVLLARLIVKLIKLGILVKNTDKQFTDGIYYCAYDGTAPFSFFRYLFINKPLFNDGELRQIISHEKVHIQQWHTIDILCAELVHAILWFNPLMIYLKRCIKLNHEYIADSEVINSGIDKKAYQLSILHNSLKHSAYQLTNLYSSSKIKTRIKMMNLKKSPKANAYKYAFVLLLVAASYFLINPLTANAVNKNRSEADAKSAAGSLKVFEGVYQVPDKSAYVKIIQVNNLLVVKQLWDGDEFPLKQKNGLEFITAGGGLLKFIKGKDGNITNALAFGHDTWQRVNSDVIKVPVLDVQQMKALEGFYQCGANKAAYVQVIAKQNTLIAKQLWDGKEITMEAQSDISFLVHVPYFRIIKFSKGDKGSATKFITANKTEWNKVDRYIPVDAVKLPPKVLKKMEGFYEFREHKGQFLQITATANGLLLKELWDNREVNFTPTGLLTFSTSQNPEFTLQFTADNTGRFTSILAWGKDVWDRNDNYHAPVVIKLNAPDLKKLEGKYQLKNQPGQFIQISAAADGLVLKQLWDNQEINFVATSPMEFFSQKEPGFTLQFSVDGGGHVTQVLAFGQDVWEIVK